MISLINGETLKELKKIPGNSVDIGVTSPPYNKKEKNNGWLVKNVVYDKYIDLMSESDYQQNQIEVLNELFRIIKPGGSFFYNHKVRTENGKMLHPFEWIHKTKWNLRQEIIWDRQIAGNIRGWRFWQVEERIYWLEKPKSKNRLIGKELKSKHALMTSIWRIRPETSKNHPAAFPFEIPLRCIYSVLDDKKGVIIDPYNGSGTTGVVAKFLDCDYIGIDLSKEYLDFSKQRIDNFESEREQFVKEINLHFVRETFTEKKANGKYKKPADKSAQYKSYQENQVRLF